MSGAKREAVASRSNKAGGPSKDAVQAAGEDKIGDCAMKSGQAYQVIGTLAAAAGLFEHPEVQRALDYFSQDGVDPEFLPFNLPIAPEQA